MWAPVAPRFTHVGAGWSDRLDGEAGRPPLGRPAWHKCHRPGGDARESAIGTGSMIRRLLLELWLWEDLSGAGGVELSMAPD